MSIEEGYNFYQEIHSILKIYPDKVRWFRYETPGLFQRFDLAEKMPKRERRQYVPDVDAEKQSLRRAKTKVMDIALCNDFDLMVTFTFSPKKLNRFDDNLVKRCLYNWVNHQRARYGASAGLARREREVRRYFAFRQSGRTSPARTGGRRPHL